MTVLNKPHWRCDVCDSSRYRVFKDRITCYKCGKSYENMELEIVS